MNEMNSGDESDDDPMSTEILEGILDRSQSHPNINRREACYKIRDSIDNSIIPPLLSKEEMNEMNSGDESDDDTM